MSTESILPRRQQQKIRDDVEARRIVDLLRQVAARVDKQPSVAPPEEGMIRLSGMDRASFVWFLRCPKGAKDRADGDLCNHGFGVDRHHHGDYEVRAWAHGAPGVHAVSLHTHEVTLEVLETVAGLVGIPLEPVRDGYQGSVMRVENHGFSDMEDKG